MTELEQIHWIAEQIGEFMDNLGLNDRVGSDTLFGLVFMLAMRLEEVGHPLNPEMLDEMLRKAVFNAVLLSE